MSGNFRVSGRTGFLFGPMQNFLFVSNQQLSNLPSFFFFSFSEASFGASQFFQVIVGGNMPLDCGRGLATVGSLKGNISCGNVSKVIFLSFQ